MSMFEHERGCDGQHTSRQDCNTRGQHADPPPAGRRDAPPAAFDRGATIGEDQLQSTALEISDDHQAPAAAVLEEESPERTLAAPMSAAGDNDDAAAVADGPIQTIDTRKISVAPLVGVALAAAASGFVIWRIALWRRHRQ